MRSHSVTTGRRLLVILEPGDEVLASIAAACRLHGIEQAVVVTFSGAFRSARLIAAARPPADPEAPMPDTVEVAYSEGVGSGTVTSDAGGLTVHVHVALGEKGDSGAARAGHLLHAETQYVVEIVLDEILAPRLGRGRHPDAHGVPVLVALEEEGAGEKGSGEPCATGTPPSAG